MSTRCQIRFEEYGQYDDGTKYEKKAQIYRHSDGYPSSVMADLKKFYEWYSNPPLAREFDPSYMAADFIYYMKLDLYKQVRAGDDYLQGYDKIGYGVESVGAIHGDEEYLYRIVLDRVEHPDETEPIIYVSITFTEPEGFDNTNWIEYGTLSVAYIKAMKEDE